MTFRPYSKEAQLKRERKPYRRKVVSRKTWETIIDAKGGPCRVCNDPGHNGRFRGRITFHHVIPRDWNGDDVPENVVPVCDICHAALHNRNKSHCRALLASLTDAEYAYCVSKVGESFDVRIYGIEYQRG